MSGHAYRNGSNGRTEQFHRPKIALTGIEDMPHAGAVKWYDKDKRYGFILPDSGGKDVFLHAATVRLYGLHADVLLPGVRVSFCTEAQAGRGPVATAIAIR